MLKLLFFSLQVCNKIEENGYQYIQIIFELLFFILSFNFIYFYIFTLKKITFKLNSTSKNTLKLGGLPKFYTY